MGLSGLLRDQLVPFGGADFRSDQFGSRIRAPKRFWLFVAPKLNRGLVPVLTTGPAGGKLTLKVAVRAGRFGIWSGARIHLKNLAGAAGSFLTRTGCGPCRIEIGIWSLGAV